MLVKLIGVVAFLSVLVDGQIPVIISLTTSTPQHFSETPCQTSLFDVADVNAIFSCVGAGTFTASITRTVTPTGPALSCFVLTAASCAGLACGGTCSIRVQVNPAAAGCTINYEELASPTFTYGVQVLFTITGAFVGSNVIIVSAPVDDCNEPPYFTSVAYNTQLPEYVGYNVTTYAGIIGSIDVRDPDVYHAVYGAISLQVVQVTFNSSGVAIDKTPFYFLSPSANNQITTTLMFDTARCTPGTQQETCLGYFNYISPTSPVYEISIRAVDGNGLTVTITYTVTVTQVFDKPYFTDLPSYVTVPETDIGVKSIYPVIATQKNGLPITFTIRTVYPPLGTTYFDATTATCMTTAPVLPARCADIRLTALVTSGVLNYYAVSQFNLTIEATIWTGATYLSGTGTLVVNIQLINRTPIPTISTATVKIGEDQTSAMCIWTVTAWDREGDQILYTIPTPVTPNSGPGTTMTVNQTTGAICFDSTSAEVTACCGWLFDSLTVPEYTISVLVADAASTQTPKYTFTLTLSLIYRNRPPVITSLANGTSMYVWECSSSGVANTLTATDPDNDWLLFSINPQPNNALMFSMSPITAQAPTTSLLRYSTPPPFNLSISPLTFTLKVSDSKWSKTVDVSVYVKKCDTPPYFTNLANMTFLDENQTGMANFFTVTAMDKDFGDGDTVEYFFKLTPSNVISSTDRYFEIGQNTGIIRYVIGPTPVFDAYTNSSYVLSVVAVTPMPMNGPTSTPVSISNQLSIFIHPINKPPIFVKPSPTTGDTQPIYENASMTFNLYTLNATDREGDPLFYKILDIMPVYNPAFRIPVGLNYIEFNVQTANTTPPLDYFTLNTYYIKLEVNDSFSTPISTTTLTISVSRCDKPPVWTSLPASVNVREDVTQRAELLTINARDINYGLGYTISYVYVGVTPANGSDKFFYDATSRAFGYTNNPNFNYQKQSAYQAVFVASNSVFSSTSFVNILIVQRASPTSGSLGGSGSSGGSSTITIDETQTYASLIWDLRTTDNSSVSLVYGMASVMPATNIFTVTSEGLVKIQANPGLDYQKVPQYILTLTVANKNVPPSTSTFTLTVKVRNEPSMPSLKNLPSSISITEGMPGAGVLFTPICYDVDGLALTYSSSVLPTSVQDQFSVSPTTGVVSTLASTRIVYKSTTNIYIVLTCSNNYYSTSATLTINVQFTQYWSMTQSTTTPRTTTTLPTTTTAECTNCLTSTQIGAIAGSIGGALALAGIAYGLAKLVQGQAAKQGVMQSIRQVSPPPGYY